MQISPVYPQIDPTIRREDVYWPEELPSDETVLKIVTEDCRQAETWIQGHGLQQMWDEADRLYAGRVPVEYWTGTKIPRAHLGMPIVLEHINGLLPQMIQEFFADERCYVTIPKGRTSMNAVRGVNVLLDWELEQSEWPSEVRYGWLECLSYGTGFWQWGWCVEEDRQVKYGGAQGFPLVGRPFVRFVECRNMLVDPGCRIPDIRKAKWAAEKIYMTPLQIDALRNDPSYFNIPSRAELGLVAIPPVEDTPIDRIDNNQRPLFPEFETQYKHIPTTQDPLGKPLKVVQYTTKEWIYTVYNDKRVIRKQKNVWGRINYCSVPFIPVTGSFYGIGVAGLIGNEQKLQQGVINLWLDNKQLQLSPPFLRRRGSNIHTQQIRMRPGAIIDVDDTEKGLGQVAVADATPDIYQLLGMSDARAQRRSGSNEFNQGSLATQNSALRSATGVQALQSGSGARVADFLDRFSVQVAEPVLEAFHYMNDQLDPNIVQQLLNNELLAEYRPTPKQVSGARLDIEVRAGKQMRARQAMDASLPLLLNHYENPSVQASLKSQQKVVNHNELTNMVMDVSRWPNKKDIVRDMTKEEVSQMAIMESPAVQSLIKRQEMQIQTDQQLQVVQRENEGRMARDIVKSMMLMMQQKYGKDLEFEAQLLTQIDALMSGGGQHGPIAGNTGGSSAGNGPGGSAQQPRMGDSAGRDQLAGRGGAVPANK